MGYGTVTYATVGFNREGAHVTGAGLREGR